MKQQVALVLATSFLVWAADSFVVQPTWNHVKLKKVPPARLDARLTGEVDVVCSATGSPAPQVAWYKDSLFLAHPELEAGEAGSGGRVDSLGETVARLRLPCLAREHAGVYECRARAGIKEASVTMDLRVVDFEYNVCAELGEPQIVLWRPTLMLEEGSTAVLPCRTESKDDIVKWSYNGEEVLQPGVSKYSLSSAGDLLIHDLRFSDMGEYTCTAANSRASTTINTFVYPLAPGGLTTF